MLSSESGRTMGLAKVQSSHRNRRKNDQNWIYQPIEARRFASPMDLGSNTTQNTVTKKSRLIARIARAPNQIQETIEFAAQELLEAPPDLADGHARRHRQGLTRGDILALT